MDVEHNFLYVEDDPLSQEALKLVLTRVMQVENMWTFDSSENFIDRVKALPALPDVFLLDIHVKPHTGFEMLEMIQAQPELTNAIAIALTASVMNEEIDMLRTSGFNGAIGKPIQVATFPGVIERIISGESLWHITG